MSQSNIETIKHWNGFVIKHGPRSGAFLQSWEWGEFQESMRRAISRYVLTENKWCLLENGVSSMSNVKCQTSNVWNGVTQVIKIPLPFGRSYLSVPRGPVAISDFRFQISDFLSKLNDFVKQEKVIFIKLELPIEKELFNKINLQSAIGNLQSKSIQPKNTLILNLEKSEEELLANMREKTRYNIRLAERKGATVRWSTSETLEQDLEKFWKLAQATAKRDRFNYHPKSYYEKMLKNFRFQISDFRFPEKTKLNIGMAIAEKDGEALAANIIVFFGSTATYLHGASNYEHRELMAPHLLQWHAIQEAKKFGYKYYDFWGVSPPQTEKFQVSSFKFQEKHPWAGITRFKMGFGGEVVSYVPALDFPISKFWYKIYSLAKKIR